MVCKAWVLLSVIVVGSAAPGFAQQGSEAGLSRLLAGPARPIEPQPMRAAAAELAELRALPHALIAVGDLQAAASLLARARALLGDVEAHQAREQATETAWVHLAVAGRRLALHYTQLELRRLREVLSADGEAPAAHPSDGPPTADEVQTLAPDYAARVARMRRRVSEAADGLERGHAQELLQLWEQAATLEARRIRGERQRATLSRDRVARRRAWLAQRWAAAEERLGAERKAAAGEQQQAAAAAYRRLSALGETRGALQPEQRDAIERLLLLSELWVETATHLAEMPVERLHAARALVSRARSELLRPQVTARAALRACERAVQNAEALLGETGLAPAALPEQAALRGLVARDDGAGGAWVSLPGPRMEAPAGATEFAYALGGMYRMFPHLSVTVSAPAHRGALRRALERALAHAEWVVSDDPIAEVRFAARAGQQP